MSVLLHISDPHFGTERSEVVEALLELHAALGPELVVVSGDITQRARSSQFARARAFFEQLTGSARLVIPGNHDVPLFNLAARVFRPYRRYRAALGWELSPEFESADLSVIGLNTTRSWRFENGEISSDQVSRVAQRLQCADQSKLRVVVTHQPVHVITGKDGKNIAHGSERAVRAWTASGVDLLLGGHIHLPYVRPLAEGYPGLARRSWIVQAGTAVSSRVRGAIPNSVNVLRFARTSPKRCVVERWDYRAPSFRLHQSHTLDLD